MPKRQPRASAVTLGLGRSWFSCRRKCDGEWKVNCWESQRSAAIQENGKRRKGKPNQCVEATRLPRRQPRRLTLTLEEEEKLSCAAWREARRIRRRRSGKCAGFTERERPEKIEASNQRLQPTRRTEWRSESEKRTDRYASRLRRDVGRQRQCDRQSENAGSGKR